MPKEETKIVIFPGEDAYAIISARAKTQGKTPNQYAKEVLLEGLRKDGLGEALEFIAAKVSDTADVTAVTAEHVKNIGNANRQEFGKFGELLTEVLEKLDDLINQSKAQAETGERKK